MVSCHQCTRHLFGGAWLAAGNLLVQNLKRQENSPRF
jgi:hypothetical protein